MRARSICDVLLDQDTGVAGAEKGRGGRAAETRSLWAMARALTFTLGELDARGGF